jgi:hypothetical protein
MDKMDHLMAEKNKNNNDSQKGQVTPKKYLKKPFYYHLLINLMLKNFSYKKVPHLFSFSFSDEPI